MDIIETYKRGQLEWALWRSLTRGAGRIGAPEQAPSMFCTRIKRLLELDRASADDEVYAELDIPYAFCDATPQGQGNEIEYRSFNAFVLGLGLELLDAGYKQSEIVFLLKYIREMLETEFEEIQKRPLKPSRVPQLAANYPESPTFTVNGALQADWRVFITLVQIEMTEIFGRAVVDAKRRKPQPTFLEPHIFWGREALDTWIDKRSISFRRAMIMEIANLAHNVVRFLEQAPEIKRGRRS